MLIKIKLFFHLVFTSKRKGFLYFLYVFLLSLFFAFSYILPYIPTNESLTHFKQMDENTVLAEVEAPSTDAKDFDSIMSLGNKHFEAIRQNFRFNNSIKSFRTYLHISIDSTHSYESYYMDLCENINNFGDYGIVNRKLNEVYSFNSSKGNHLRLDSKYFLNTAREDLEPMDNFFISRPYSIVFSDPSLIKTLYPDLTSTSLSFIYRITLNRKLTFNDGRSLELSLKDNPSFLSGDLLSCFEPYRRAYSTYDAYDLLSKNLEVLILFLIILTSVSLILSQYINLRSNKTDLLCLYAFGLTDFKFYSFNALSTFIHSLIGYLAFLIIYKIVDTFFINYLGYSIFLVLPIVLPLILLLISSLISFSVRIKQKL